MPIFSKVSFYWEQKCIWKECQKTDFKSCPIHTNRRAKGAKDVELKGHDPCNRNRPKA